MIFTFGTVSLVAKPSCFFHVLFSLLKSNLNSLFLLDFLILKITLLKYLEFQKIKFKQVFVTDILELVCGFKMIKLFVFSVTIFILS